MSEVSFGDQRTMNKNSARRFTEAALHHITALLSSSIISGSVGTGVGNLVSGYGYGYGYGLC